MGNKKTRQQRTPSLEPPQILKQKTKTIQKSPAIALSCHSRVFRFRYGSEALPSSSVIEGANFNPISGVLPRVLIPGAPPLHGVRFRPFLGQQRLVAALRTGHVSSTVSALYVALVSRSGGTTQTQNLWGPGLMSTCQT